MSFWQVDFQEQLFTLEAWHGLLSRWEAQCAVAVFQYDRLSHVNGLFQ